MEHLDRHDFHRLSDATAFLRRCKLPPTTFNAYLLRQEARHFYAPILATKSLEELLKTGFAGEDTTTKEQSRAAVLDRLFPIVERDVDVLEDGLGSPISPEEACFRFVEPEIQMDRVPNHQIPFLDMKAGTLTDVITLQDLPLSDFVQMRGTGELLSREAFQGFIDRNTTTWMGRPNVGFRFGKKEGSGDEFIYGNLVSWNFDRIGFFPQPPGVLTLRRVANGSNVPSSTRPKEVVPTHYFEGEFRGHRFFLPDTPDGRVVLSLFKDAFKKGNLYGMTSAGRVRHGRVHKKTSLTGTFGYPDDTYLVRVAGELRALGSTPFLYQFSTDPNYDPGTDPYPEEKSFRLVYKTDRRRKTNDKTNS